MTETKYHREKTHIGVSSAATAEIWPASMQFRTCVQQAPALKGACHTCCQVLVHSHTLTLCST